jgi:hypothetical protein
MTVWWGLAGLLGLLGCCGLLRSHRADEAAVPEREDPLARYPVAREPATPNADAAHTPLMTPAITPEMLAGHGGPAGPRQDAVVPESGSIAGEIPAPRPQSGEVGERPGAPVTVSAVQAEGSVPGPGVGGAPESVPVRDSAVPPAAAQPAVGSVPGPGVGSAPVSSGHVPAAQPAVGSGPASSAPPGWAVEPPTGVPQQPKHALRTEASAPEAAGVPRARAPEPAAPHHRPHQQPPEDSGGLVGNLRRLMRRA